MSAKVSRKGMKMNRGWLVTFSGTGLNLALGVLYSWSVFGKQLTDTLDKGGFGWTKTQAALPYTIAIAFFAGMMVWQLIWVLTKVPETKDVSLEELEKRLIKES